MPIAIGQLVFYTVEDLAQKFKVSPATIYGYIKNGKLPAKRFGKKYQISETMLERFLMSTESDVAEVQS